MVPRSASTPRWQALLGRFETVGLSQVANSATSNRIDTKFALREESVFEVLNDLKDECRILDVDGQKFSTYRTQYFDTESYALFRRHHAGRSNRYKVRARTYLNTQMSYVEIKRRTPAGMTTKVRRPTEQFETRLTAASREFIDTHCSIGASELMPMLLNSFDRICLVSKNASERLTIDLNVEIETGVEPICLQGVAVAEFKQERSNRSDRDAAFLRQMRAINVRPTRFSKYCMGLLLTNSDIKHNRFKPQLKELGRLMEEPNVVR